MKNANAYTVADKREAWLNGRRVTLFKLWHCESDALVFAGEHAAPGWRLSDAKCIEHAEAVEADD
jgi:hypothetical protein